MPSLRTLAGVAVAVAATTAFTAIPADPQPHDGKQVRCDAEDLRQAIAQANAAGGGTLKLADDCTYTLTAPDNDNNGLPVIITPITIHGNGSTIRRSTQLGTPDFRIFRINGPKGELTLADLTIRDGRASGNSGRGGGIWLASTGTKLTLDGVTVTNNFANLQGGGVDDDGGTVTVRNSDLSHNHASFSGGMDMDGGAATFWHSRIDGNTATGNIGGIFASGTLTLNNSRVTNNTSGESGGGILTDANTTTTVNDTIVSGNTALGRMGLGGGIYNTSGSQLIIYQSKVFDNKAVGSGGRGGGIANDQGSTATLRNSSVTDNVSYAPPGGIFNNGGTVTLIETRVEKNDPTNCTPSAPSVTGCTN